MQKLFKLIRHLRETLPSPKRALKGCCKQMQERKMAEERKGDDEKEEDVCEEGEEEDVGEEGEEEEGLEDDPVLEVEPVKSVLKKERKHASPVSEPVRRMAKKTPVETEDVLFLGSSKSQEQQELDAVRAKIEALRLGVPDSYDDHCSCSCVACI